MNLNKSERPEKKRKKEKKKRELLWTRGKEHITQHKTVQKFDDP